MRERASSRDAVKSWEESAVQNSSNAVPQRTLVLPVLTTKPVRSFVMFGTMSPTRVIISVMATKSPTSPPLTQSFI